MVVNLHVEHFVVGGPDDAAIVDARLEVHHLAVPLQQRNEGQEGTALDSVLVEFC